MTENDDLVVGTEGQDTLEGLGGNDTLQGLGGNDVLRGGEGSDLLEAGDGFDQLIGGPGNDTIIGGGGTNRLDYKSEGGPNGIVLNLASGQVTDTFGFTDTVSNIQQVYGPAIGSLLIGSDSNESIHGDNGADTIQAGGGNDSLRGYRGNDTIQGEDGNDSIDGGDGDDLVEGGDGHDNLAGAKGNDTIDGGAGINIANYQSDGNGLLGSITVNLATGVATDSNGDTDTLLNIQHVYGKYNANNFITGDDQDNSIRGHNADDTLAGGGGDDELLGFDGNDSLLGGPGDDELLGGRGDDFFDGGAGTGDTAYFRNDTDYANNGPGVIVDLAAGTATDGFGGSDTLIEIENVVGTEVADQLSGDENDNDLTAFGGNDLLVGRGGNDFLWGMDGDDTLQGGDGNDELWGFSGDDTLEGGAGIDTATYSNRPTDYSAEIVGEQIILTGPDGVDTITGVERFHFFRQGIALDLDGNAGDIAKLLGVMLGSEWYNQDYISIGLDILDNSNISFEQLMEQALDFILGSEPDNAEVVGLIYTNLIGNAPAEGDLNYFVGLIEDGTYTQVSMAVEAANHELNLENINLVGLMETGLAFTPLEWL